MSTIPSSYRLVQMDSPFEQWDNPLIRQLFERTITLKINGYGRKYPSGVIPFDISCWYASHFLVCEDGEGFQPVMGFQRVTLEQYRKHYAPFAPLSSCKQVGRIEHIRAMEELVARADDRPEKLSYTGGFTVDPKLRANRELVEELCRLMVVLHYFFHREAGEGHEIVTAPTLRFKVESLLSPYGFFPLVDPGLEGDEGDLSFASYAGEKVRFMRVKTFNQEMMRFAERYQTLWDNRILLCRTSPENPMARGAGGGDLRSDFRGSRDLTTAGNASSEMTPSKGSGHDAR